MAEESREQLLASVKGFLVEGKYSDLVITCGTDSYNVHKVVVCSRADFFARAVRFAAANDTDASKIDLPEDEPEIVKLLMQYLYEAEYDPPLMSHHTDTVAQHTFPHTCSDNYCYNNYSVRQICKHHCCGVGCNYTCNNFSCQLCIPPVLGDAAQLLVHAKMYEIADKYDVIGLKDLCKAKFSRACQHFWNAQSFPIAGNHVFSTTPDHDKGLRNIVCKAISDHMILLDKPEIEALMTEFNGLAFGLLKEKAKAQGWCST